MDEQREVITRLEAAGILAGVRWAYASATARTLESYSEDDGHDATWLGNTRFTLFRDRLDRVFACRRYSLQPGSAATVSLDVLHAQLSERDVTTMPRLAPDLVERVDLDGSPGWAWEDLRFLLASCAFGKLDMLPWPRKSPTKQRVARQPNPQPQTPTLFDDMADEEIAGLVALFTETHRLDLDTFVVAHTLEPLSHRTELVFGRPRMNAGGGEAWHWYENLQGASPAPHNTYLGTTQPSAPGADTTPDAPVYRRRAAQVQDQANGE